MVVKYENEIHVNLSSKETILHSEFGRFLFLKKSSFTLHRDSDKRLRNKSKSGHEERVLATQNCLAAGRNGQAFDARYLLDF